MRARLHVQRGQIGFYREGTHSLCDAASTRQLLPATVDALRALEQEIGRLPGIDGSQIELAENVPALSASPVNRRARLGPSMQSLPAIAGLTGLAPSVPTSPRVHVAAGTRPCTIRSRSRHRVECWLSRSSGRCIRFPGQSISSRPADGGCCGVFRPGAFSISMPGRPVCDDSRGSRRCRDCGCRGRSDAATDLDKMQPAEGRILPRHNPVERFLADSCLWSSTRRYRSSTHGS
jgi:hypothetical protein